MNKDIFNYGLNGNVIVVFACLSYCSNKSGMVFPSVKKAATYHDTGTNKLCKSSNQCNSRLCYEAAVVMRGFRNSRIVLFTSKTEMG